MSGIAGIYHFDKAPVLPEQIQKMADTLFHRGPDKQGIWCDHNVGLASLLLQTTPESLYEELPYYDQEAQIGITADARIDNRIELLSLLDNNKHDPLTISDSKLILLAYKKWGIECHSHLLGDFAVVIWDKKEQRFFALRDHFGVKPFYYYLSNKIFAFASEIKTLLQLPQVTEEINEEKIADFMANQDDGSSTFYKSILILRPSHFLLSNNTKVVEQKYWSIEIGPLLELQDNREYTEAFKEIFTESVRCRLRRTGSIGSHLSGGLDSSSITCTARDILISQGEEQLHTFSYFFKDLKECDERKYIDPIVKQGNVIPHFVQADQFPTKNEYDEIQTTLEEASYAFNVAPGWKINKLAHKLGIKVQLHGFDGDTTVSHGTGRLSELARSMQWLKLIREGEGYANHFSIPHGKITYYYLKNYSFLFYFFQTASMLKKQLSKIFESQHIHKNQNTNTFLSTEFYQRIAANERFHKLSQSCSKKTFNEQVSQVQRLSAHYMPTTLSLLDRTAAHFSVEKRFPFWDKRLIMFCLSLPSEQKLDHGWNRIIMRRAMESSLPTSVCWRGGKADLAPHANKLCVKLISDYHLQNEDIIQNVAKYLDSEKIKSLLESPKNSLDGSFSLQFYRIIGLMLWMRHRERPTGCEG